MVSRHTGHWSTYPPVYLVGTAFAAFITALLIGLAASHFHQWRSWWAIGLGTVVGWFAVMSLMLLVVRIVYPATNGAKFQNTDETMKHFASEAAKWVKEGKGVELDYSFESIKLIEDQLAELAKKVDRANPQPGMRGQAVSYGAYVGEVFRRQFGGSWGVDHPNGGENSFPLTTRSNTVVFPVLWSWKRVINGDEDNVYHKALLFAQPDLLSTNAVEMKLAH